MATTARTVMLGIILLKKLASIFKRKPKQPKTKQLEAIIWARLKAPAFGMMIFAASIIFVISIDYYNHLEEARLFGEIVDLFYEWQTLIGGGFAIVAAVFAGRVITVQIARAEEIEQARLTAASLVDQRNMTRSLMAARSVMPLTLNVLTDYTGAIARAAVAVLDRSPKARVRMSAEEMPDLPSAPREIITDLQTFIIAAPDEIGSNVADVLSDLQLLSANAESAWRRTSSKDEGEVVVQANFEALVGRAAVLYARLSALYPYARRETEQAPGAPLEADVSTALALWKIFPEIRSGCHEAAATYFKKATRRVLGTAPPPSPANH